MTTADFGRRGRYADLAVADPFADGSDGNHYGRVSVLYGSTAGLTAQDDQLWTTGALRRKDPRFFGTTMPNESSWWED